MEQTFDCKYPWIKNPGLFSLELFPINAYVNISALINKLKFAILLTPFLFVSIIGIKKWRNLLLIFLWLLAFFLFFSFWWGCSVTEPGLYQVIILSPIAAGIASGWAVFYNYLSTLILNEQIRKVLLNSFFVFLILGSFIPSYSKHYAKEEVCPKDDLQDVLKRVSADSCILANNVGYARVSASIVAKYSTNREILTDPKNCKTEKIYYLKYVPFRSTGQDFEKNCFIRGCDAKVIIVKNNWVLCKLFVA